MSVFWNGRTCFFVFLAYCSNVKTLNIFNGVKKRPHTSFTGENIQKTANHSQVDHARVVPRRTQRVCNESNVRVRPLYR